MIKSALNARLLSAAELVRQNATLADIGTDHAYLPLFLLDCGKINSAYCCDINEGPLAAARRNAEERGRLSDTDFILTDGAAVLSGKGITDYAICGMGGELIADIIDRAPHLKDENVNLILQPMTKQEKLRAYLASSGFKITHESYSFDAGKYYVCLGATYCGECREITPLEAIAGAKDAIYSNPQCRVKYLEARLRSLERAYNGKSESGNQTLADKELIDELTDYIKNI